ncbi:hypothetical protein ACIGW3_12390 [Streptomyces sp. NPDC053499]|uniref:hypothetical protein n=1 Tax=Streptomyces sp. NPDC053499 TaxID=3365707 RepID=UPI0037D3FEFC
MAAQNRDRVVHFYEIVHDQDSHARMPHRDWGELYRPLAQMPLEDRTVISEGETLIGAVEPAQTAPHLMIARLRQDRPQQVDFDDGSFGYLQLAANKGLVDVTTLYFLPFGNVVATMAGGLSAPRARALQRWFNGMGLTGGKVRLRPVVNARSREKLEQAQTVDQVTITLQPEPSDSPSSLRRTANLGEVASRLHEAYPDMDITLTLAVPKKRRGLSALRRSRGQRQLLDATRALARDLDDWLDNSDAVAQGRADAHVLQWNQQIEDEKIDFVSERITAKCVLPSTSTDGHTIDLHVALTQLEQVALDHQRTLRAAVGADL